MDTLDRTVADILGEPPEAMSRDGRKAVRRSAARRGATAAVLVLVLTVAGIATFAAWRRMPASPPVSEEAHLARPNAGPVASQGQPAAAVVADVAPTPVTQAPPSNVSDTPLASTGATPSVAPPPPAPPDRETVARLKAEAAPYEPRIEPKIALAPKMEQLKVARAERLRVNSPPPDLNIEARPRAVQPVWVRQPSSEDVDRVYPSDALIDGVPGSVELNCRERIDGSVDKCEVLRETPLGAGFGRAALKLSRSFRFTPYLSNGQPAEISVQIPYDFSVSD